MRRIGWAVQAALVGAIAGFSVAVVEMVIRPGPSPVVTSRGPGGFAPAADESGAPAAWANAGAWADARGKARYLDNPTLTLEQLRRDVDAGKVTGITALDIAVVAQRGGK